MAEDSTDPFFEPDSAAPAAVVRRRGEGYDQLNARAQGYSDQQTGYGQQRVSALDRSARMALAREREARMQEQADQRNSLAERSYALREKEFAAQQQVHASAQRDKDAALAQATAYLAEEDALAAKHGIYSKPYIEGALAAARKYPAAVLGDSRIGSKLQHYEEFYAKNLGGNPDLPTALWEVGQFDPSSLAPDEAAKYLGELPGKYPTVANDKAFSSLIEQKLKDVTARGALAQAKEAGLVQGRTTVDGPGGDTTFVSPKAAKEPKPTKPDTFKDFNKELTEMVTAFGGADKVPHEKWVEFEKRRNAIGTKPDGSGNEPPRTPPTSTAAGGEDPRRKLAQQAINDPSASEAHKAAARRILGL